MALAHLRFNFKNSSTMEKLKEPLHAQYLHKTGHTFQVAPDLLSEENIQATLFIFCRWIVR